MLLSTQPSSQEIAGHSGSSRSHLSHPSMFLSSTNGTSPIHRRHAWRDQRRRHFDLPTGRHGLGGHFSTRRPRFPSASLSTQFHAFRRYLATFHLQRPQPSMISPMGHPRRRLINKPCSVYSFFMYSSLFLSRHFMFLFRSTRLYAYFTHCSPQYDFCSCNKTHPAFPAFSTYPAKLNRTASSHCQMDHQFTTQGNG